MSRIRSQLDSILASENTAAMPQRVEPRHAYPPAAPVRHSRPTMARQPIAPAPSPELETLQNSLEQLSRKIAAMPRPAAPAPAVQHPNPAVMGQMRDTLVSEMRTGFSGIRDDFTRVTQGIQSSVTNSLSSDLKRVSDGIALLQNSSSMHPDYVEQMQAELGNLSAGITQLLQRPSASQVDLSGVSQALESNYSDIVSRLDQVLTERGNEMPAMELPDFSPQFQQISDRLEEMTRAVVSLTVNPDNTVEHHAIERIEARLASLSKSVNDLVEGEQFGVETAQSEADNIAGQIAKLSEKLDNMEAMGAAGEALGQEIFPDVKELAARLDALHNDVGLIATNLEKGLIAQQDAQHQAQQNVMTATASAPADPQAMAAIESHLAQLAGRFDELATGATDNPNASGQEILSVLRDLVRRVEGLEQIASAASDMEAVGDEQSPSRFDALESQLSDIVRQLGGISTGAPAEFDMGPITERLDHIEGQIATSRDIVIDIATEAAQRAVATGAGSADSSEALAAMMDEIRALREGQQNFDSGAGAANADLSEIGSTMAAIADRLTQIEENALNQAQFMVGMPAQPLPSEPISPGLQPAGTMADADIAGTTVPDFDLPEAAMQPQAPQEEIPTIEDAPSIDMAQSMDARAMDAGAVESEFSPTVEPMVDETEVDQMEEEDVPLEPGSGMPDLETLVQRATRKKKAKAGEGEGTSASSDDGLSDLMAAARRAAQAASVEAESVREAEPKKKKGSLIGKLTSFSKPSLPGRKNRSDSKSSSDSKPLAGSRALAGGKGLPGKKALLMTTAAVVVAAGGFLLAPKFLGSESQQVQTSEVAAPAAESPTDDMNANQSASEVTSDDKDSTQLADMGDEGAADSSSMLISPDAGQASTMMEPAGENSAAVSPAGESVPASLTASGDLPPEELGNLAFRQAIANGNGDALFEAGKRYTDGQLVPRDLKQAVVWYTKAAEAGHAPAQYRLGNFHEKGHGVEANPGEAVKWYAMAAKKGNALAMHNLAVLNATGVVSGDADMAAAVSWFEKAADLGVKDSQVNLGILFTKGMGVGEDLEKAYKWFAIAAKGGDSDAAKKRDTVAQAMRPEQLEKARGAAEIWKPGKIDPIANIAKVADSWKPAVDPKKMTKAEMVKMAQTLLAQAGFDAGPADGMMGAKTRNAIAAFQEANGLPIDGTISRELMEALTKKVNI